MRYTIAKCKLADGNSPEMLTDRVNVLLKQGWELYGNLVVIRDNDVLRFYQALKTDAPDEENIDQNKPGKFII